MGDKNVLNVLVMSLSNELMRESNLLPAWQIIISIINILVNFFFIELVYILCVIVILVSTL